MSIYDKLNFNQVVSFEVFPSSIIGTQFVDVRYVGMFDADTARNYVDPFALHANVFPTLPAGTPDDPTQYEWAKFILANGKTQVIGVPWIKEDTLTVSQRGTVTITIKNVTPQDKDAIVTAISANGYRIDSLTMV